MGALTWILTFAIAAAVAYGLWRARTVWEERRRASEKRLAQLVAQASKATSADPAAPAAGEAIALTRQRLLLEAAGKAAEAGEPALAIQLYARLISRYPGGPSAALARTAVEAQKKRLSPSSTKTPDTSARG